MQTALSAMLGDLDAALSVPPVCRLRRAEGGQRWGARVSAGVLSAAAYSAFESQLLSPEGMAAYMAAAGLPCSTSGARFSLISPSSGGGGGGGSSNATSGGCSDELPALCCAVPCCGVCVAGALVADPSNVTDAELLALKLAVDVEAAGRA